MKAKIIVLLFETLGATAGDDELKHEICVLAGARVFEVDESERDEGRLAGNATKRNNISRDAVAFGEEVRPAAINQLLKPPFSVHYLV